MKNECTQSVQIAESTVPLEDMCPAYARVISVVVQAWKHKYLKQKTPENELSCFE